MSRNIGWVRKRELRRGMVWETVDLSSVSSPESVINCRLKIGILVCITQDNVLCDAGQKTSKLFTATLAYFCEFSPIQQDRWSSSLTHWGPLTLGSAATVAIQRLFIIVFLKKNDVYMFLLCFKS